MYFRERKEGRQQKKKGSKLNENLFLHSLIKYHFLIIRKYLFLEEVSLEFYLCITLREY